MTSKPDSSSSSSSEIETNDARDVLRERARDAIAKQPARTVTILSSLLAAQDELGYLPVEAIDEVAARMTASANSVWGIASFYPNFRFTPPNRHKVELCWGPTCHVLGAQHILQGLLPQLGLDNEGETEDGVISLKLNTCLGVCAHGPAMSFDEELAGHMSLDKAIRLVERIKAYDEEVERGVLILKDVERSKAEIAAKAAVRTAERAAMAQAAAAEAAAKLAAEEEARAQADAEWPTTEVEKAPQPPVAASAVVAEAAVAEEDAKSPGDDALAGDSPSVDGSTLSGEEPSEETKDD
ncbi:MAG: NAD(P)H-dependent oxidoreductase subunit E [Chloroflexi bacterium]|nr:NAD(P)H-dependent oxidoreductase subunit E [Chloroflexota bacterium]MDA1173874.1 NAD(P)H-dependent oxidoreductase subunit E [Chloroflexota bacterium]